MKCKRIRLACGLMAVLVLGLSSVLCQAEDGVGFKSESDKESYSLGYQFGSSLKRQPVELDLAVVVDGVRDAFEGKDRKLAVEEMDELIAGLKKKVWTRQQKIYQEKAAGNLKLGKAFLIENAKKEGVKTLPSGLQYKVIREGTGPTPKATDTVTVHYRGTLMDGTEFDNSYSRAKPSTVRLFGVIKGWTEALRLMKAGARWQIFVPAKLGYGDRKHGRIPPNSVLVFDLELLSFQEDPLPAEARGEHENNDTLVERPAVTVPQTPSDVQPGMEKD